MDGKKQKVTPRCMADFVQYARTRESRKIDIFENGPLTFFENLEYPNFREVQTT